jgi:hypothetical protein
MNEFLPLFALYGAPPVFAVWIGAIAFVVQNGRVRPSQSLALFLAAVVGWHLFVIDAAFTAPSSARDVLRSLVWTVCLAVPIGITLGTGWVAQRLGATTPAVAVVASIAVLPASLVVAPLVLIIGCVALGDCI